jgi:hypothetical protein
MTKIKNITIGTDPEMFLKKDGVIISAIGKIGGSKHDPLPISDNGHFIQEDNVAIEYNIPACTTKEEFIYHNNFVKDYLDTVVTAIGCELDFSASAILSDEELDSDQARLAGCEPDFDVWRQDVNIAPDLSASNMRVCGGHVSIGWDNPTESSQEDMVKAMDATLGLKSLFLDSDTERKKLYGKAGCFRFRDYGIEYRTLSNFWIKTNESLAWVFDTTMEAIELVNSGKIDLIKEKYADKIVEAINTNNKSLAQELLNEFSLINSEKLELI